MFKRYGWMLLVMAPVGMMAGFMVAAVVTYVMPKKYESFATIEIKPREREAVDSVSLSRCGGMTEIVCGTDFDVFKSRSLLSKVIDSLDLMNRWAVDRETALRHLKDIVWTENKPGTDLIQIRVRHTNKEDARDIAAGVAEAYKEHKDEEFSESIVKATLEIKRAVRKQEDKVEKRRKILTEISRSSGDTFDETQPANMRNYDRAKRDFEIDLALLEELLLRLNTDVISQLIFGETVVVHDDPVIADSPISPNVTLNLVAGTFGGGLLSTFLALPLMWFMSRRKSGSSEGF